MKQKLFLILLQAFVVLGLNAEVLTGSCGTNLTYNLDTSTGVLKIVGSGKMMDYDVWIDVPWISHRTDIKTLELSESLTSIGNYAFYECSGLTSVTIPNSVTRIGYEAFYRCTNVKELIYEEGCLTALRTYLTSIERVTIPNSVTSIENSAFYNCSGLTSVTIPNSVTSIGEEAFSYCSGLTSVTIPNSVTSIGSSTFSGCSGLTSVTIPNSVTSIGNLAFDRCSGLRDIHSNATTPPSAASNTFDGVKTMANCMFPLVQKRIMLLRQGGRHL